MKFLTVILITFYYLSGTLFLPSGDFSALTEMRDMYTHCKTFEDKNMTPVDFITDHLLNIDGWFDAHDKGDEQKPHQPNTAHHFNLFNTQLVNIQYPVLHLPIPLQTPFSAIKDESFISPYHAVLFRPPIVSG